MSGISNFHDVIKNGSIEEIEDLISFHEYCISIAKEELKQRHMCVEQKK
jgi:hypothetical protein